MGVGPGQLLVGFSQGLASGCEFQVGDSVSCVDPRGRERARGLIAYTSKDIARIQGLSTREASRVLGYWNGDAVIHRDDLVVLEK